jgi:O-acetyl-ADP-ribose deacetylase (regulator of RNase III)
MPIREVAGDILLAKTDIIAHGVAPQDEFNSGLAASIGQQWPDLVPAFQKYCKELHPMPGDGWTFGTGG